MRVKVRSKVKCDAIFRIFIHQYHFLYVASTNKGKGLLVLKMKGIL